MYYISTSKLPFFDSLERILFSYLIKLHVLDLPGYYGVYSRHLVD